jgi:hypothetical protein
MIKMHAMQQVVACHATSCGLQGAYLGDAVGFGGGGGRVSKSVFDEESSGICFRGPIRTSSGSKAQFLAPGA